MLKFIFWLLLIANGVLWAYGSGHFGTSDDSARQPARMSNQLNAERLKLIAPPKAPTTSQAQPATLGELASSTAVAGDESTKEVAGKEVTAKEVTAKEAVAKEAAAVAPVSSAAAALLACIEIGNFTSVEASNFESRLRVLALGQRQSRINMPGSEASNYIVYLPAQGGKEGAARQVTQLQRLGVQNYFVMADSVTLRWAVSLGVFKTETAAQNLLASLIKLGVSNARVAPRATSSTLFSFQLRGLGFELQSRLKQIKADFPAQQMRTCQVAQG